MRDVTGPKHPQVFDIRRTAVTFFGCGDAPFAAGTVGSAGALAAAGAWYAAVRWFTDAGAAGVWLHGGLAMGVLAACVLSVAWGRWAVKALADHPNTRKPGDPGAFVLDEVAGQWLALLLLPMSDPAHACAIAAAQFFAFRAADVIKPPPGRRLEKLPGGWGILLDDLAAAVYANLIGQAVFRLGLGWT